MPFRPGTGTGGSFYGFKPCKIVSVKEVESSSWNPDINIEFEMAIEGSQYTKGYRLAGIFDRDSEGNIMSCAFLNRIYNIVDTLDMNIGVNRNGEWVDFEDNKIDNIVEVFSAAAEKANQEFPLYCFLYKAPPNAGYNKPLTKFANRIMKNAPKGRSDLESFVKFMKANGHIKEYVETDTDHSTEETEETPF